MHTPETSSPPQELAATIPLFRDAREIAIQPLEGVVSLNNANYRVTADGAEYVLRVASAGAAHLGIRRDEEREAALAAARVGVGPEVRYFDDGGHMVTPFIPGRHWTGEELRGEEHQRRLAETLRRMRDCPGLQAQGSVYRRVERLLASARGLQVELPAEMERLVARMHAFEAERQGRFVPGLCHNDLWCNNFLDDGQRLWLLDWEFSGAGDGLYDVATITLAGDYSETEQRDFLTLCGYTATGDEADLRQMRWLVSLFEGSWAFVQHGLRGSAGFDYLGYARKMMERLGQR
jgi:thiamine kinase-like enzyme